MAKAKQFELALQSLLRKRTDWLRRAIGKAKPGPRPKFTRKKVQRGVSDLMAIAKSILVARLAKRAFRDSVSSRRQWHVKEGKGWNREQKKKSFARWFDDKVDASNFVYVFWGRKGKCLYVGRTEGGRNRPQAHFGSYWFGAATRIDIHVATTPGSVHRAECLAMHLWDPTHNSKRASRHKYYKHCPVCSATRDIKAELSDIFRLK